MIQGRRLFALINRYSKSFKPFATASKESKQTKKDTDNPLENSEFYGGEKLPRYYEIEARTYMEEASQALKFKDFGRSKSLLEKAKEIFKENFNEKFPGMIELLIEEGKLSLKENKPEQAIEKFEEARNIETKDLYPRSLFLNIHIGLGDAYLEKGDLEQAEDMLERCLGIISIEPNRFRQELFHVLSKLGDVYYKKGFLNEALAFYYDGLKEVVDVEKEIPIKANFLIKIAKIYLEKGEEAEGERCLGLAMELLQRDVFLDHIDDAIDCYLTWGKIHSDYGRNHLAVKYFKPVVELEMIFYGPNVVDREAYKSLQRASDTLGDKKDFEGVKEKLKKIKNKEEKSKEQEEVTEKEKKE